MAASLGVQVQVNWIDISACLPEEEPFISIHSSDPTRWRSDDIFVWRWGNRNIGDIRRRRRPLTPFNLQGIHYRRAGLFRQARDAYQAALRLRPDYAMAHINLAILCDIYLQDMDCARRHYREYLRLAGAGDNRVELWMADLEQRRESH